MHQMLAKSCDTAYEFAVNKQLCDMINEGRELKSEISIETYRYLEKNSCFLKFSSEIKIIDLFWTISSTYALPDSSPYSKCTIYLKPIFFLALHLRHENCLPMSSRVERLEVKNIVLLLFTKFFQHLSNITCYIKLSVCACVIHDVNVNENFVLSDNNDPPQPLSIPAPSYQESRKDRPKSQEPVSPREYLFELFLNVICVSSSQYYFRKTVIFIKYIYRKRSNLAFK
ncbi:hypothetical protein EGR_01414 [Echinococcus granulosus]|uniref:Uncharacterized protein n=1 Tax=Echinococcus granulosus TaxID=6210 RepID=W6USX9_ECHGR|nr:hypothetical protein EGR_01414 [Echinococcus granulosus]EUB63791.1 hypothetical protein EGR_01414 [Echinococcus granulosus]